MCGHETGRALCLWGGKGSMRECTAAKEECEELTVEKEEEASGIARLLGRVQNVQKRARAWNVRSRKRRPEQHAE